MARQDSEEIDALLTALSSHLSPPGLFEIEEIGIIKSILPATETRTRALQALVKSDNHLGLYSWVLNPLYVTCKARLARPISARDAADFLDNDLQAAAAAMLTVNPDFLTAWNIRKSAFLRRDVPNKVQSELHFSYLILTRSPKSADAWAHRNWVLAKSGISAKIDMEMELKLAWMAASRAKANYYASVHRVRVLKRLCDDRHIGAVLEHELSNSRQWLGSHVTDSSGWAYHRFLLTQLQQRNLLDCDDEVEWFTKMEKSYSSKYQNVSIQNRWLSTLQKS